MSSVKYIYRQQLFLLKAEYTVKTRRFNETWIRARVKRNLCAPCVPSQAAVIVGGAGRDEMNPTIPPFVSSFTLTIISPLLSKRTRENETRREEVREKRRKERRKELSMMSVCV
ncbi:hypothetical protein PUN28_017064 [Cardiocondyla obscurior]|uniref:Uncharacterized protein n=1 Tax=Cardiocondyla obscurior TaxID=286306 RepID=A0AAW2EK51_9HYME